MAVNFKLLFEQTGKLVLFYIMELRGLYWSLGFNRTKVFSIEILPGHKIKYAGLGDISQIIYKTAVLVKYGKSFEFSTLQLFSKIVHPGDVIIDVGANSGLYSIFYSNLVGANGLVHAFEPDKETCSLLQKNLQLNNCSNVIVHNLALSDKESRIEMVSFTPDNLHLDQGDSFKYIREVGADETDEANKFMHACPLDTLRQIGEITKIDFIKIDVEGAEFLVLKGAVQTIQRFKPVIIFELSGQWTSRFHYKPYELLVFLKDLGYEMEEYEFQQWIARPVPLAGYVNCR
ncbi:MAG: FkbM family methyltransferase [Ferruginibacter sp.]|nr:FkbM family methyltransferase [Ferruginibacter sp.]